MVITILYKLLYREVSFVQSFRAAHAHIFLI
jgi:hypothetical protein